MCHEPDDDLELDLELGELLRLGEQEADEFAQSFGTPIANCEPSANRSTNRAPMEQAGVVVT